MIKKILTIGCFLVFGHSTEVLSQSRHGGKSSSKSRASQASGQRSGKGASASSSRTRTRMPGRMAIARAATARKGYFECSKSPPSKYKCAQQASNILKRAGVPISGSDSVNTLVSQLRKIGWTNGKCMPGAVKHSSGSRGTGRHIGVIGVTGQVMHNSQALAARNGRPNCGVIREGDSGYKWGNGGARCLVPPGVWGV